MSPHDFKFELVHRDLSWKTDPDGLVKEAELTFHFLKDPEEEPVSVPLWGSLTVPL